jgi:hypothetical protein
MATYTDGSTIEDGMFTGKTAISIYALHTAKSFLNLEIRNPGMKMSRHGSALNLAENLSGLKFGRGVSGRVKAMEWVKNEIARIEEEERVS